MKMSSKSSSLDLSSYLSGIRLTHACLSEFVFSLSGKPLIVALASLFISHLVLPAAAGADIVLDQAKIYDTTADAVADCEHVYATTVRKRGVTKPVVGPDEAARLMHSQEGQHAVLFGREASGLATEDVALARHILTVPINPEFGSLNLAQAVILTAYEWSRIGLEGDASELVQPTVDEELLPPAPQDELEGLITHLEGMLAPKGYFYPEARAEATKRTLRTVLTKPGWNLLEVRTLRGVLSSLGRPDKNLSDKG